MAVADVNRDGTPDLVVSNMCADNSCTGGSVGVLLGNGDGTFQPAMTYSSGGSYAWSVAVGDLNGDDKLDLVVANFYSDTVGVLFGNGNGTFQPAVMYRTAVSGGSNPDSVAVADVNGDGKPDLVVINSVMANFLSKTVTVLLGNGDGTFQPAIAYGSGGDIPLSVAIADVNGDGKPDVSVANFWTSFQNTHGAVGVLMANGDGTFQSPVVYLSGGTSGPNSGGSIAVADVNADDKADLLVANEGNATVGVLLGNGDGTFQPVVTYGSGGSGANSLATGDVNGDGKPDVVVATSLSATVGVLLGHGNGTFQSAVTFGSGGLNRASSVAVADVNRDARPDLLVGTCANSSCSVGAVSVLLNNTSFCTSPPVVTVVPTPISLWPPDGKKAPVTVSGTILDNPGCTVTGATYAVGDEYGQVQPTGLVNLGAGGAYSFTVLLQSARRGADLDGRLYTITVSASNDAGQIGSKNATVMVAHDLGR
ncbi:MAG TPA: VCBS repeat-containing protein [Candidatus Binatia bacterium]|nr:VCBS repeat-containing protein [Candidatus Binatia bacterium]